MNIGSVAYIKLKTVCTELMIVVAVSVQCHIVMCVSVQAIVNALFIMWVKDGCLVL